MQSTNSISPSIPPPPPPQQASSRANQTMNPSYTVPSVDAYGRPTQQQQYAIPGQMPGYAGAPSYPHQQPPPPPHMAVPQQHAAAYRSPPPPPPPSVASAGMPQVPYGQQQMYGMMNPMQPTMPGMPAQMMAQAMPYGQPPPPASMYPYGSVQPYGGMPYPGGYPASPAYNYTYGTSAYNPYDPAYRAYNEGFEARSSRGHHHHKHSSHSHGTGSDDEDEHRKWHQNVLDAASTWISNLPPHVIISHYETHPHHRGDCSRSRSGSVSSSSDSERGGRSGKTKKGPDSKNVPAAVAGMLAGALLEKGYEKYRDHHRSNGGSSKGDDH